TSPSPCPHTTRPASSTPRTPAPASSSCATSPDRRSASCTSRTAGAAPRASLWSSPTSSRWKSTCERRLPAPRRSLNCYLFLDLRCSPDWEDQMIRAGRRHLVRTLADIAAQQGIAVQTLLSSGRLQTEGFPPPVSTGRTRLYDGEQIDAYLAGRPVPALPTADDDED